MNPTPTKPATAVATSTTATAPTSAAPAVKTLPAFCTPIDQGAGAIKLLLLGDSGGGKTFKAAQFAAEGKVAIINFDQNTVGLKRLEKNQQDRIVLVNPYMDKNGKEVDVKQVWKNFCEIFGLLAEMDEITTIVIDSLSTLADALNWQTLGRKDPNAKPDGFEHWRVFGNHLKLFCDVVLHDPALDKHIILIAHDKVDKNPVTGEISREILLDGGMKDKFALHFSDIWRAYPKVPTSGKVEYRIRTVPGAGFTCKCSLPIPEDFIFDTEKQNIIPHFKNLSKKG